MNATDSKHLQRGASMVEYSLLVCLLALIAVVGVAGVGKGVEDVFDKTKDEFAGGSQWPGQGAPCNPAHPSFPNC